MNVTWLYVAALYALAVWLARRAGVAIPVRVALFFYAIVLIFLFKPMTQAYVNLPVDIVTTLPPWSFALPKHRVQNFEMNDIVMQIVPWAHQAREALRSFHWPLWNSMSGAGYPLLANGQSSGLSPLRILALPLPLGYAFTAEAAMKMLIALTFTYLFARRRGWNELPCVMSAVAFAFCTFIQTWLHFPLVTVGCWIPAAFLSIDLFFEDFRFRISDFGLQNKSKIQNPKSKINPRFLFFIAVWTIMFLGGHPETVSHVAFLGALYVAWIAFVEQPRKWRESLRAIGAIALAGTLALIISSPFLAPFLQTVKKSQRFQELQIYPNAIGYYSDLPSEIVLFQPHFFGHVPHERPWGPAVAESITGFAGVLGIACWFAVLIRAIVRRQFRDREFFFVVATPIILGIILAWPIVSTGFHLLFKLAANARLRLLLCWCIAMLTGAGVDAVQRERAWPLLAGLAVVAGTFWLLMTQTEFPEVWWKDTAMIAIVPSLTVVAASLLFALPQRFRTWATMIVLVATIAELWSASEGWNPNLPLDESYPTTPLITKLRGLRLADGPAKPYRIVGLGAALFPNAQALFGFEDVRAHDPMAFGNYLGFLRVLVGYNTSDYFAKWNDTDTRVLDLLNVKYVITDPKYELKDVERYRLLYDGKDGRIYENHDVLPRFFAVQNVVLHFHRDAFAKNLAQHTGWSSFAIVLGGIKLIGGDQERTDLLAPLPLNAPRAKVTLLDSTGTDFRMRVHAPRYSMIVSSIPYFPGWRITHNGRSLTPVQVNSAFVGFVVPPGDGEVRVHYVPLTFYGGLAASLLTIIALVVLTRRGILRG
jgi:hypothetical protein